MSDQVTHPKWEFDDDPEWVPWSGAVEIFAHGKTVLWAEYWLNDPGLARRIAEQVVSAVNSHDALTARVAELESANAMWQQNSRDAASAMLAMRNAINEYVPIQSIESDLHRGPETSVFCEVVATAVTTRVAELEAENERMRAALAPFADIGIGSNPDYEPMIRMDRKAIVSARAALTKPEA